MKRRAIGLAVAVAAGWAMVAGAEEKVAIINVSGVVKQYYKTKLADEQMERQADEFRAERDRMMAERDRRVEAFEKAREEAEDKGLSEEARDRKREAAEDRLADLKEYELKIQQTTGQRRRQLEEQRTLMYKGILEDVQRVVRDYARAEGLTLVLDASDLLGTGLGAVIYREDRLDISEAIAARLNSQQAAGEAAAPGSAKP